MRSKCPQCQKLRIRLLSNYALLILFNYILRSYFGFETITITDLLFIPTLLVLVIGIISLINKTVISSTK